MQFTDVAVYVIVPIFSLLGIALFAMVYFGNVDVHHYIEFLIEVWGEFELIGGGIWVTIREGGVVAGENVENRTTSLHGDIFPDNGNSSVGSVLE